MAAPKLSRAAFILLSAVLLAAPFARADGVIATSDELLGLQAGCEKSSTGGALDAFVMSEANCRTCMSDLNSLTSPMNTRMYACHSICQNPLYFNAGTGSPSQCQDCLSTAQNSPYGCENCLRVLTSTSDRQGCITCLGQDPTDGKRPDYMWACAQCMTIPTTDGARQQCLNCISTAKARPIANGGMLSADEVNSDSYDPLNPRPNDFGACVVLANRTYNIGQGSVEVDGVYANCVPSGYAAASPKPFLPLGLNECMSCMSTVLSHTPSAPSFLHKEYACSSYCQDPAAYPMDLSGDPALIPQADKDRAAALATACVACVEDQGVADAWGCGNCMKAANPTACFECVQNDPYEGRASNYAWACGQCGRISDPDLQGLCYQCIGSQPVPEVNDAGVITNANFNVSTEANICSCIDLTLNSSIPVAFALDAQQRACFEPQQYYDKNGVLVVPDIPWGNDTTLADPTTTPCIQCIDDARTQANAQWNPRDNSNPPINFPSKAYACTEYCQSPRLVADEAEGDACAQCVKSALITDAFGCKLCMEATADPSKRTEREDCFTCLQAPTGLPNYQWGCSECAKFNGNARTACYRCLAGGDVDPCDCISATKNGTLPDIGGTCPEPGFKVRIWYLVATYPDTATPYTLGTATWRLDTTNPWASPVSPECAGTFSGGSPTEHYLGTVPLPLGAFDFRADVYSQYIDLSGCALSPGTDYFFTVKDATTNPLNANTNENVGLALWDLSQDPEGASYYYYSYDGSVLDDGTTPLEATLAHSLAFQLLDNCNDLLVSTISTVSFGAEVVQVGTSPDNTNAPGGFPAAKAGSTRRFTMPTP